MGRGQILETVISGLQTGVDQMGLQVARELRYKTGGTCPKGFRTDAGPAVELAALYGVQEHKWSSGYAPRTQKNVWDSTGTVIFDAVAAVEYDYYQGKGSPGCLLTWKSCKDQKRPLCVNPSVAELQAFLIEHEIIVLNVAGNRLRTHPESTDRARVVLLGGLIPF